MPQSREGRYGVLSSGTWALRIERTPVLTPGVQRNLSNEGVCKHHALAEESQGLDSSVLRRSGGNGRRFTRRADGAAGREPGFHHLIDPDGPILSVRIHAGRDRCRCCGPDSVSDEPGVTSRAVLTDELKTDSVENLENIPAVERED